MVKVRSLLIALMVMGIGIWAFIHFSQSEEEKVRKQFDLLSEWASKAQSETPLVMAQKIKKIGTLFAENCVLNVPLYSTSGSFTREEIISYAARGRLLFSELYLRFYDLTVTFPEEGTAKVSSTARLTGKLNIGENVDEIHELECVLKKIEKRWFFNHLEVVEVLKK
jgi:hypothetical protein